MAFSDLEEAVNAACTLAFGVAATWTAVAGAPVAITGIIGDPAFDEQAVPGSLAGVSNLLLWVDLNTLSGTPAKGDQVTVNGVAYTIGNVKADIESGAVLVLKRA